MAAAKPLLFSIFFALIFTKTSAGLGTSNDDEGVYKSDVSDSSLKIELDQLKSKISILESSIGERTHELTSKDEKIKHLEMIIQEKSTSVASLQSEIKSFQEKGTIDVKEQVGKAHARAGELEKQVDNLKKETEKQNTKKNTLEARASEAENKFQELHLKLGNLQTINDDQKIRIRKIERALQVAEEEMMKAKFEDTKISKELIEVREAWLPTWLAVHLLHCQSFIATQWNEHGRPALDVTLRKSLEMIAEVGQWAELHIDTFKTKLIPIIKEHWFAFVSNIEPNVQSFAAKTIGVYYASKNNIGPHIVKVQKMVDPYYQEAKKFTKPYINQVSTMTKPHVHKARVFLKPYTKKVLRGYKKFIKATAKYHLQVQATTREVLKRHELTKPLAINELVWFMASALMALPVIFLFNMASAIFCKKPKKHARNSHTSHTRRRAKRVHLDK